jgi:hypothetical protein
MTLVVTDSCGVRGLYREVDAHKNLQLQLTEHEQSARKDK